MTARTVDLSPEQLERTLQALREARDVFVGRTIGCADCDEAERKDGSACVAHRADDDKADLLTTLGEQLAAAD